MFASRPIEKPATKTRFRKQAEEEMVDKQKKKQQLKKLSETKGYDMWKDDHDGF